MVGNYVVDVLTLCRTSQLGLFIACQTCRSDPLRSVTTGRADPLRR